VDRALQQAAGLVMVPLQREVQEIDADVRRLLGDVEGSRRVAQELVASLEAKGVNRFAEHLRREFLDEPPANRG
jgi:hypothetical protein